MLASYLPLRLCCRLTGIKLGLCADMRGAQAGSFIQGRWGQKRAAEHQDATGMQGGRLSRAHFLFQGLACARPCCGERVPTPAQALHGCLSACKPSTAAEQEQQHTAGSAAGPASRGRETHNLSSYLAEAFKEVVDVGKALILGQPLLHRPTIDALNQQAHQHIVILDDGRTRSHEAYGTRLSLSVQAIAASNSAVQAHRLRQCP